MNLVRYTYPSFRTFAPAVAGFARSPWTGLESEIDRLFESTVGDLHRGPASSRFPVDLYEDKENTYVRAELPGVSREDINVEMVDGYLTITATRKAPARSTTAEPNEAGSEGSFSFSRSVSITDEIHADKVTAAYENGVLTVTLPKREEAKPKKITVAVK